LPALLACMPPPVLRSALVPDAYLPSHVGAPLGDGEIRISGEAGGAMTKQQVHASPEVSGVFEAPGVYLPRLHVGGSVYANVATTGADRLEMGGQLHYSSYGWSEGNVNGVAPLVNSDHLVWGGGGARFDHEFGEGAFLGGTLQVDLAVIHESTWVNGSYTGDTSESFLLPSLYG